MTETTPNISAETPENYEDKYVRKYLEECANAGMSENDIEPIEEIRERYREAREIISRHSREHLVELRDLLNGLVIKYVNETAALLKPEVVSDRQSESLPPKLLPETECFVQYVDDIDGNISAADLRTEFNDILANYSDEDVSYLVRELKHLHTNASRLTTDNLQRGGDRVRRELAASISKFKQSLGNNIDEAPVQHIPFAVKLGLEKNLNGVLWVRFNENDELPDFPLFNDQEILPVGEYGELFTRRLLTSMRLMIDSTRLVKDEAYQLVRENKDRFEHTARGNESSRQLDSAALRSLQEGIISFFQAVHLLTSEKVKGYPNGDELFQAIVENDLLREFAYVCPAGVIGPVTLIGKHIKDLLIMGDEGQLQINPSIRQLMLAEKKEVVARKVEELLRMRDIGYEQNQELPSAGRGCPVAYTSDELSDAGISELSQLAYKIFTFTK